MDEQLVTRYARTRDGVSLAYHAMGKGPPNLLWVQGIAYPIDLLWEEPGFVRLAKRLRGFSRTIWFEGRGLGASGGSFLDLYDEGVFDDDVSALLDAAECERAVLVGTGPTGHSCVRISATKPDRVAGLVLIDTFAHYVRETAYPIGFRPETLEEVCTHIRDSWGTGMSVALALSKANDTGFKAWTARCERLGHSPEQVADAFQHFCNQDVRLLLPEISVPTLVLHREADPWISTTAGRYLGEHIPGAKYVELPGTDHHYFAGDVDTLVDAIEEFLTGAHQAPEGDVSLAAVLFTDIVSSTEQSARMGHRKWSTLTDQHDAMVRASLQRHKGHEVKTIGDGFLATFDATSRAVRAATEIVAQARMMGIEVRAGVHTGEVEVRPDDVVGLTVSIAKRVCDLAGPGQVFVSETVKSQLVGSGIAVSEQGSHVLKGVPDEWRLFAIEG